MTLVERMRTLFLLHDLISHTPLNPQANIHNTSCVTAQSCPSLSSDRVIITDLVRSLRLKVIPRSHDTRRLSLILQHQYYIKHVSTKFLIFVRSFEKILQTMINHFSLYRILWPGPRTGDWSLVCGGATPSSSPDPISVKINPNALIVFFPFKPP